MKLKNIFVVYQIKDTIFWKQITTISFWYKAMMELFIRSKIQFFESKSQRLKVWSLRLRVVYQIKDTIFWKQITTICISTCSTTGLFIRSKIQFFESKSQPPRMFFCTQRVVYQIKDTIFWKQITTGWIVQYQFYRCLSDQRYNFLKANHNKYDPILLDIKVVYQIKDTIFWKLFTINTINQSVTRRWETV